MYYEQSVAIVFLSFFSELIDLSLGMGYGTIMSPVLILFGFSARKIVPTLLLSQVVAGFVGVFFHDRFGNITLKRRSKHRKIAGVLITSNILGLTLAVLLATTFSEELVEAGIGIIIVVTGIILMQKKANRVKFSWSKIFSLGLVSGFNKGLSGGGYGPLVTSGQIISGVKHKSSVGITTLVEAVISMLGAIMYFSIAGTPFDFRFFALILLGAIPATPMAAYFVKQIKKKEFTRAIGTSTIVLGILMLTHALL